MLYIVGGISRSGKSMIARKILSNYGIPYMSLDYLMMGFTNGMPELGIRDTLNPDEIAVKMWPFVQAMAENILWSGKDYLLEGEAILPWQVKMLCDKFPGKVKACFVGYPTVEIDTKVAEVYQYSEGDCDWLTRESREYIVDHITRMKEYSRTIQNLCQKEGFLFLDSSKDFLGVMEAAIDSLYRE